MNGFGDLEEKLKTLFIQLGSSEPVDLDSSVQELSIPPETVLEKINSHFFPDDEDFGVSEITRDMTLHEIVSEIAGEFRRRDGRMEAGD